MTAMKASELRNQQYRAMRENADFLPQVVEAFQRFGWAVHHVLDTRAPAKRIGPGFPDLVLAHPRHGILYAELKAEAGQTTPQQDAWIDLLNVAAKAMGLRGRPAVVWRPHDIDKIIDIAQHGLRHVEQ